MVDNELITKVRVRNVKSILSNVFTSSGGTITNGNGTTANGSAVDLGGTQNANIAINDGGTHSWSIQYPSSFRVDDASGNTFNLAGGSGITLSSSAGLSLISSGVPFTLTLGSDATGDQYHRNDSGYLVRRGTVSASSTSSLTIDSNTTYQYSLTALAAALSIEAPTGTPFNGQDLLIRIKDNATARGLTWNAIFRVIGVTLPTTTVISKTMYIACIYNSTDTKWDVIGVREQE